MTTLEQYREAAEFFEEMSRLGNRSAGHKFTKLAASVLSALASGENVLVPKELTAENGLKWALIGEFRESLEVTDSDGSTYVETVPVSWHNIKAIHKRVVEIAAGGAIMTDDTKRPDALKLASDLANQAAEQYTPLFEPTKRPQPVAWLVQDHFDDGTPKPCGALVWAGRKAEDDFPIGTKFYTAPPNAAERPEPVAALIVEDDSLSATTLLSGWHVLKDLPSGVHKLYLAPPDTSAIRREERELPPRMELREYHDDESPGKTYEYNKYVSGWNDCLDAIRAMGEV